MISKKKVANELTLLIYRCLQETASGGYPIRDDSSDGVGIYISRIDLRGGTLEVSIELVEADRILRQYDYSIRIADEKLERPCIASPSELAELDDTA